MFSLLDKKNVHLIGQCCPVCPLEVNVGLQQHPFAINASFFGGFLCFGRLLVNCLCLISLHICGHQLTSVISPYTSNFFFCLLVWHDPAYVIASFKEVIYELIQDFLWHWLEHHFMRGHPAMNNNMAVTKICRVLKFCVVMSYSKLHSFYYGFFSVKWQYNNAGKDRFCMVNTKSVFNFELDVDN